MTTKDEKPAAAPKAIISDAARRAYAAYITQKRIRELPRCPLTFDELDTEEQAAWRAAVGELP